MGRVLGGAAAIVHEVAEERRSVILHCSDGWDRTAQLCALSELCLDPYYRTALGFKVLVQKEWQGFGHKFRERVWGHKVKERSPIFFQFLDAVHQLIRKHPTAFEFTEQVLLRLLDALYSNAYSVRAPHHSFFITPDSWYCDIFRVGVLHL